jgi:NhaP-type Na+/H+ or K+/H+ antiporter
VFTLAVVATDLGLEGHGHSGVAGAVLELVWGVVVGLAVGVGCAVVIGFGTRRRWIVAGGRRLATLAAALSSFALAVALEGNGFIAAFVAGIAFGAALPKDVDVEEIGELPELLGELLALAVWFLFGAALVPVAFDHFSVSTLAYAVLSLTVLRMVPVALALIGTGMDRPTVLFVGWFGPRGLASVVFALLAVEETNGSSTMGQAIAVVALTVLLSVVLHGVSAGPFGSRYVRAEEPVTEAAAPRARRPGHLHRADTP